MLIKLQSKTLNINNSKRSKKSCKHELSSFIGFCFKIPRKQIRLFRGMLLAALAKSLCSREEPNSTCLKSGILKQNHQFSNSFISRINPSRPFWVLAPFGLLLFSILNVTLCNILLNATNNVSAASVSITVTGSSSSSIDLLPTATTRDFKKSGNVQVTVSTTDASNGYTLTIADKNNDNQRLTGTSSSNYLTSITSAASESTFNANLTTANSTYDNKWGILPSKVNSTANTNYQPGPKKTTPTTIDVTSTTGSNTYTFAIGARVDNNQAKDTYTGTFTLAASVNATPYAIGFRDLLGNMPEVLGGTTTGTTVTIPDLSSNLPIKPGYTFKGWCRTATTDNTCSTVTQGSTTPDIPITGGSYDLSNGAVKDLYAMWEPATFDSLFAAAGYSQLEGYYKMQDMNSTICSKASTGLQGQLIDSRDKTVYWIGKQADGKCWMTQNLDLILSDTALTNADTDLNSKVSWTPPTTARTATKTVDHTNKAVSGWTDDSNVPYSAEGGDAYYYTTGNGDNEEAKTLAECVAVSGLTETECKHYHVGNYYNWTAAVAMDSTSAYTTQYISAPDSICPKGWRLPVGLSDSIRTDNSAEFASLLYRSGIIPQITSFGSGAFAADGFNNIRKAPIYFIRTGYVDGSGLYYSGNYAYGWSSSVYDSNDVYYLYFRSGVVNPANYSGRRGGLGVRCVAR